MNVTIVLTITLDDDLLIAVAERCGQPVEVIVRELAYDLECRAHDSCRWRDGVERVGSSVAVIELAESRAGSSS